MDDLPIKNARITSTKLGREDHGIFTFVIYVEIQGGACCGIGCYALDCFDKDSEKRIFRAESMEIISKILDVVGVDNWEDLKGKYIRIRDRGWGSTIDEIGNLMDDKWVNIRHFFESIQEEERERNS